MASPDLKDNGARGVNLVNLAETAMLDLLDLEARTDSLDHLGKLERQEKGVKTDHLVAPDHLDHEERLDHKDHRDNLDQLDRGEKTDSLDHKDKGVKLDNLDKMANQDSLDLRDHRDRKARGETVVRMASGESLDFLANLDSLDNLDQMASLDSVERPDLRVRRDRQVLKAHRVRGENVERTDNQEHLEIPDSVVRMVNAESRDHRSVYLGYTSGSSEIKFRSPISVEGLMTQIEKRVLTFRVLLAVLVHLDHGETTDSPDHLVSAARLDLKDSRVPRVRVEARATVVSVESLDLLDKLANQEHRYMLKPAILREQLVTRLRQGSEILPHFFVYQFSLRRAKLAFHANGFAGTAGRTRFTWTKRTARRSRTRRAARKRRAAWISRTTRRAGSTRTKRIQRSVSAAPIILFCLKFPSHLTLWRDRIYVSRHWSKKGQETSNRNYI